MRSTMTNLKYHTPSNKYQVYIVVVIYSISMFSLVMFGPRTSAL